MNFWILKTEPSTYSFEQLQKDKKARWDGVRNYQARNNLRAMKVGDKAFIYHSGDVKAVVGLAQVSKTAYKDPTSKEDWAAVDLTVVGPLKEIVTLAQMKAHQILREMILVKNSRLSVSLLKKEEFELLSKLGGLKKY